MRVLLIGQSRWTAEGLAAAVQRAAMSGSEPLTLQPQGLEEWRQADAAGERQVGDVVVLAGLAAAEVREVLGRMPLDLPVLVLTTAGAMDEAAEHARANPARPFGCLPDDATQAQLHAAIQAVALGLSVRMSGAAGAAPPAFTSVPNAADELHDPLTARELEVFELMAKGLGNRDIASALGISAHTAKFHVAQILDKTGSATRTEAVHHGLRLGLVGL